MLKTSLASQEQWKAQQHTAFRGGGWGEFPLPSYKLNERKLVALKYLRNVVSSLNFALNEDDFQNLFGMPAWECWRLLDEVISLHTSGPPATKATPPKKLRTALTGYDNSPALRPANASTASTRKSAKRAAIGRKSRAPYLWGEK